MNAAWWWIQEMQNSSKFQLSHLKDVVNDQQLCKIYDYSIHILQSFNCLPAQKLLFWHLWSSFTTSPVRFQCEHGIELPPWHNCNVYQSSLPIFFGSFSSVYPDTWHNLAETHLKRNFGTDTSQLWQSLFHLETVTRVSKSQCHVFTILITFGVIQLCQIYERNRKIYKKTFFWIKLIENSLLKKNNNFSPIESVVVLDKPQNNIVIITGLGKVEIFVPMAMAFAGENEAWLENSYV